MDQCQCQWQWQWQSLNYNVRHFKIYNRFFPMGTKYSTISNTYSQLNTATYYHLTKHFLGNRMILKEYFYYYSVAERSESLRV